MKRWTLKCVACEKKDTFADTTEISQSHWKILAWDMNENAPVVVCSKCEYPKTNKK